ncbi:hypothetical protein GGQ84_000616 [Desulfitispora alkaliphila]|uniref:DUF1659 domain-containing protein n=1 Tax=Desulfitispora alkaliphila TaxID=622674 RepID=UPI003D1B9DE0
MDIVKLPVNSGLRLVVQVGVDDEGEPQFANRNYNRLKPSASDEDTYAVAQALGSLQIYPVAAVNRTDQVTLEEQ